MTKTKAPITFDDLIGANSISAAKRMAVHLQNIESALASGVRHKAILERLNANGFSLTMNSYKSTLKRLRQMQRKESVATSPATKTTIPQPNSAPLVHPQTQTAEKTNPNENALAPRPKAPPPPPKLNWIERRGKKVDF